MLVVAFFFPSSSEISSCFRTYQELVFVSFCCFYRIKKPDGSQFPASMKKRKRKWVLNISTFYIPVTVSLFHKVKDKCGSCGIILPLPLQKVSNWSKNDKNIVRHNYS